VNRGLNGFPTRDSVVTSADPYVPLEDGGYAVVTESVRQGDMLCVNGTAGGAFPIDYGAPPSGGVAGAASGGATTVTGTLTGVTSVTATGGITGEVIVGYSTAPSTYGSPSTLQSASVACLRACVLAGGNYVALDRITASGYVEGSVMDPTGAVVSAYTTYYSTGSVLAADCAALSDGNFVVAYSGFSGLLGFTVRNSTGGSVITPTAISNPGGSSVAAVAGLAGGGFVVAYGNSTATDTRFSRFSNAGALQGSDTQVATGSGLTMCTVAALSGGGFVVAWRNTSGYPYFRVYDSAGVAVSSATQIEAAAVYNGYDSMDAVGLADGGFVIAYAISSTSVKFARFNATGTLQGSITTVEAVTAYAVALEKKLSGDFVIAYNNSTTNVRAARFNAFGTVVSSPATLEAVNSRDQGVAVACLLTGVDAFVYSNATTAVRQVRTSVAGTSSFYRYSSGGVAQGPLTAVTANPTSASASTRLVNASFVYAYTTSTGSPAFTIWSRDGLVQTTETIPEVVTSRWISVGALPNGEFVLAWESLSGALVRFGRYSAAGVLQGLLTTVEAVASARGAVAGLRNGSFAIGYLNTANAPRFAIFSATGAQIAAPATLESVVSLWIDAVGLSNGNVAFAYGPSGTSVKYITKTSIGGAALSATTVEAVSNLAGCLGALPGGEFVVAYNNSTTNLRYARYSASGALQGSLSTVEAKSVSAVACGVLNSGDFWIAYNSAGDSDVRFVRYASTAVILGVADRNAASGETVAVRTAGMFTLRDNWGAPALFDHSTATPVRGNRGTVFGKTATLNGV